MSDSSLMQGKRGLVLGVANDHSIAWGIASSVAAHGAELAFTYQGEGFAKRVAPLAESVGSKLVLPCDVSDDDSIDMVFSSIEKEWGALDFLVHSVAYSDKDELSGRYVDTTRQNFKQTLDISCFSFTTLSQRASEIMPNGGSLITLSYSGAERVMPNYNVMGVAKAALEASVKYLAMDLGANNIRVNAISAGPMRTLAGSAVGGARQVYKWNEEYSPLRQNTQLNDVGGAGLYLLSDLSAGITGEIMHVDSGYNVVGVPDLLRHREKE
ncbi:MAG: enoyl-[acyl-carrier-protein] reductase FabI [Rhodospirillaceae bacterium]|nr:enoyl-[acyl-carrier-protein] reductase FabI [Rhodospirillaceae bacterium]|tara:strand:+ start:14234 stop:15040 length:807 start_codon:yes stop_codon:yes gene_type:complete